MVMLDRTIESILAEWRAAEAELEHAVLPPEVEARIERLRGEYAAAVAAREAEAEALRRSNGIGRYD